MVQGCLDWQREGLGEPPAVTAATNEYRHAEDAVGRFLEDRCAAEPPGGKVSAYFAPWAVLLAEYENWTKANHEAALGGIRFGQELDKRGFRTATRRWGDKPTKGRVGLSLRFDPPTQEPPV
jgi:putative DNA primase/helicase